MVFTEQGVAMLSSVLNSDKAIKVNIEIMRAFAKYRGLLYETDSLHKEIVGLDEKIDTVFKYLLEKINSLNQNNIDNQQRMLIGYKIKK